MAREYEHRYTYRFMYDDTLDGGRLHADYTGYTRHGFDALREMAYEVAEDSFIDAEGLVPVSATLIRVERRAVGATAWSRVPVASSRAPVHRFVGMPALTI